MYKVILFDKDEKQNLEFSNFNGISIDKNMDLSEVMDNNVKYVHLYTEVNDYFEFSDYETIINKIVLNLKSDINIIFHNLFPGMTDKMQRIIAEYKYYYNKRFEVNIYTFVQVNNKNILGVPLSENDEFETTINYIKNVYKINEVIISSFQTTEYLKNMKIFLDLNYNNMENEIHHLIKHSSVDVNELLKLLDYNKNIDLSIKLYNTGIYNNEIAKNLNFTKYLSQVLKNNNELINSNINYKNYNENKIILNLVKYLEDYEINEKITLNIICDFDGKSYHPIFNNLEKYFNLKYNQNYLEEKHLILLLKDSQINLNKNLLAVFDLFRFLNYRTISDLILSKKDYIN